MEVELSKRVLRPFTRRGRATANGILGGTTVVSLWDPAVPEGLNEGNDYWTDGQILILSGDMADQVREVTAFVQATGVITVAPRFVNPNVSLLTVDLPAGVVIVVADAGACVNGSLLFQDVAAAAVVIPVADATLLRAGAAVIFDVTGASEAINILAVDTATNLIVIPPPGIVLAAGYTVANAATIAMAATYIWDNAPNAEALVITGIDLTLNQLTVQAPGVVAGYTVANAAAISVPPTILDDVQFVLMSPALMAVAAGALFDVSDRWARELGQVDIARVLGAALNAANPVISGIFDALGNRMPAGDVPARQIFTEDSGANTNPERWLHDNHWNTDAEIPIVAAGAPGELALGAAVGVGVVRRIREVTARHTGTANTVISILDVSGGNVIISFDVPAQSTRTWSSQDGRVVAATLQPVVQTSDITGGGAIVSAAGVESA